MLVRLLATAALAGGITAAPIQPDPTPAVTTLKYRVGIGTSSVVDLSAFGQGERQNNAGITGFFTMTLTDTTGGQALVVVLDSMVVDSASQEMATLQTAADSAKGTTWSALLRKDGKVENLTSAQLGVGAAQFESMLAAFFPRGEAHKRKQGDTWSDTLSYTSTSETGSMSVTLRTTFTAAGEGTYHNAKALRITSASTSNSSGSQVGPGGEVEIEGTGAGIGEYFVSKDGRYLGGTSTLDTDLLVTTSQAPMPIPLKQHAVITTTLL